VLLICAKKYSGMRVDLIIPPDCLVFRHKDNLLYFVTEFWWGGGVDGGTAKDIQHCWIVTNI